MVAAFIASAACLAVMVPVHRLPVTQPIASRGALRTLRAMTETEPQMDVAEKLFNFFFGAPEQGEVAGLARTASAPDTYPATKTEFAEPVDGDSKEVSMLRSRPTQPRCLTCMVET